MKYFRIIVWGTPLYNYEPWKDEPSNFYYYLEINKMPTFDPVFSYQVLEEVPATDFINSTFGGSTYGFLVNQKARNFLNSINADLNHKYYPIKMLQEINQQASDSPAYYHSTPYWYFFIVNPDYVNWVDFKKTIFFARPLKGDILQNIRFENSEQFSLFKSEEKYDIGCEMLFLNDEFKKKKLDIFVVPQLAAKSSYYQIVVSENFKERVEKAKLTGIHRFIELPIYVD